MVQTDVRIIAVNIVQPYLVVDDLPWLLSADLTDATIHRESVIYKGLTRTAPGSGLVELLLRKHAHHVLSVIPPPTPPAYAIPAYNKKTHSQDSVLCRLLYK